MTITKNQKEIVLNLLKWMTEKSYEFTIEEPIDKPEILQQNPGDKFCEFNANFVFCIDYPKQTFKFLENHSMLNKIIKYLNSHKQSILENQKHKTKIAKKYNNSYHWQWPEPCDSMTSPIELVLENVLDNATNSLKSMGLSYQGEFVGNAEV